jgi:hypothetical protein
VTPDELRKEADSAELMARVVSYRPDKLWLTAKAAELRRLAERMEARSWEPTDHHPGEEDDAKPQ